MKYFLFWLILFPFLSLKAQEVVKPDWHITPKLHYGFIWNFDDEVAHLANQHYTAYELSITKQTKGNKEWQNAYRLPQVGYSLYYFSFDRTKPVGNIAAVLIHAGKNIYKTKRSNLQWRIGFGTAYTERRFDYQNNFKNNVVSQRINFGLNGQLNFNCHITQKVFLNLGLELMHFSNGALKRPNFGVNLPAAHVGIGLKLIGSESLTKKDTASFFKRKTSVHLSSFWGYKEVYPVNGPKYLLGGLNAIIEQRINRKSGLHAGLDFSYDHSKKSEIDYDAIPVENNFITEVKLPYYWDMKCI